jgi:hypothetical protein
MKNDTEEAVEAVIAENDHLREQVITLQRQNLHLRLLATARTGRLRTPEALSKQWSVRSVG